VIQDRSEQLFRTLAETAADAILTMDERSVISFANAAVHKILGYYPEELIGRRMTVLMPQRFRRQHRAGVRRYRATGEKRIPWSGVELLALHRDGREIPVEISFGEFVSGGEHIFTGIVRDVTERNEQRVALEQTASELQATVAQLEARTAEAEAASHAKSEFLAAMSHELRTPLQAVIGYTGLLTAGLGGPLTDDQMQKLSRIQLSAEHLLQLIDQVLDVARSDVGSLRLHIERVDANEVTAEACDLVRPQAAGKALRFTCAYGDHEALHRVHADRQRIRQILLNLLTNAVKFTDQGGVEVRTDVNESEGVAVIHISDTGVGLAPREAERIFQPFYQVEATRRKRAPGTGLGLSISRRLALAMGGNIRVASKKGKGSRFTLALPLETTKSRPPE
jgi:PAS domain S-box-containing protein